MKIRITFEEIESSPEVVIEIPNDSECLKYAEITTGKELGTWDAVAAYECAIARFLASGISVDIIG